MATKTKPSTSAAAPVETVPQPPQTPPPGAAGGGDYSPFVWKQLGDIQQAMGRMEATLNQVQRAQERADEKTDKIEEKLSGVTHKIYAASVILAILVVIGGFFVNKAWDIMMLTIVERSAVDEQAMPKAKQP